MHNGQRISLAKACEEYLTSPLVLKCEQVPACCTCAGHAHVYKCRLYPKGLARSHVHIACIQNILVQHKCRPTCVATSSNFTTNYRWPLTSQTSVLCDANNIYLPLQTPICLCARTASAIAMHVTCCASLPCNALQCRVFVAELLQL